MQTFYQEAQSRSVGEAARLALMTVKQAASIPSSLLLGAVSADREVAVADLWQDLGDKVKGLAGTWTAYTALGSFTVYLLGYLTLRFHLTALGVGTDLAVLDERYLFAGAKFLRLPGVLRPHCGAARAGGLCPGVSPISPPGLETPEKTRGLSERPLAEAHHLVVRS